MDLNLGIDLTNKTLRSVDGSPLTLPPLVQGDMLNVVLQGMTVNPNGSYNLVPIPFDTIKMGIGLIDAPPILGTYKLQVDGVSTPALAYNSSKTFIETQLNALSSVSSRGGMTVVKGGAPNILWIAWSDPTVTTPLTVVNAALFPNCFTRVTSWPLSGGTVFLVKIFQAPVAFTDAFALPSSPAVTCVNARTGSTVANAIQKITIPTNAQGEFSLTWSGITSTVVPVGTATAAAIASALNLLFTDGVTRFNVTQPGVDYYYVEFVGPLAGAAQSLITVTMISQPPLITPAASLDLNVPGLEVALDGAASVKMRLEIEIDSGGPGTPIQTDVTILAQMIDDTMTLANHDPLFTEQQATTIEAPNTAEAAQTIIGMLGYLNNSVGDTVATSVTINHNLATTSVFIEVIDNNTKIRLPDNGYTAEIVDANNVLITYPTAPTLNQYSVLVSAAFPAPWTGNLNLHISDISGLQAALDALSATGNPLDLWPTIPLSKLPEIPFSQLTGNLPAGMLPSNVALLDANGYLPLTNLPTSVPRVLPDGSLAVSLDGKTWTTIISKDGTIDGGIFGDLSKSPAFVSSVLAVLAGNGATPTGIIMIPFQPISEIIGFRGVAPTPDPLLGYNDSQFRNAHLLLPGDSSFERILWSISINAQQLTTGRTLTVDWGVALQILKANCAAEYTLVVEQGIYADSGSPSRLNISWNTGSPIFSEVIVLTKELTIHSFGVLINRLLVSGSPVNHLMQSLYGTTAENDSAAPSTANFALRCRLKSLNTDTTSGPRGLISYGLTASQQPLNTTATTPQAVIRLS